MGMSREKKTAWARADRKKNPDKYRRAHKKYCRNNPEKVRGSNRQSGKKWYEAGGREHQRRAEMKYKYGLTPEEYVALCFAQNNRCAICRNPETAKHNGQLKRLAVDHDHVTGRVRGLLCQACNVLLGNSRENVLTLQAAIQYLLRSDALC
jgi:hypothetical protein